MLEAERQQDQAVEFMDELLDRQDDLQKAIDRARAALPQKRKR